MGNCTLKEVQVTQLRRTLMKLHIKFRLIKDFPHIVIVNLFDLGRRSTFLKEEVQHQ